MLLTECMVQVATPTHHPFPCLQICLYLFSNRTTGKGSQRDPRPALCGCLLATRVPRLCRLFGATFCAAWLKISNPPSTICRAVVSRYRLPNPSPSPYFLGEQPLCFTFPDCLHPTCNMSAASKKHNRQLESGAQNNRLIVILFTSSIFNLTRIQTLSRRPRAKITA
jgi:hypothetical protein